MKTPSIVLATILTVASAHAATTIDAANPNAYAANIGWINCRGDVANGAVVGEFVCSGFIYSANCGWISLGNGAPTNGIRYGNLAAADYGVNTEQYFANGVTFEAKLRGYAYGANIGWIAFENTGNPRVNLSTGRLLGYAWGANVGWIALSETGVTVNTTVIAAGTDGDGDGIPDAWERTHAASLLLMNAGTDSDHDGILDKDEYAADTEPFDANDYLRITILVAPRNVGCTGRCDGSDLDEQADVVRSGDALLVAPATVADQIAPGGVVTFDRFNDPCCCRSRSASPPLRASCRAVAQAISGDELAVDRWGGNRGRVRKMKPLWSCAEIEHRGVEIWTWTGSTTA